MTHQDVTAERPQLMLMQEESPTDRRALKAICTSAQRISEIIQRLQDIRQYRTKPYVGDMEIVDFRESSKEAPP